MVIIRAGIGLRQLSKIITKQSPTNSGLALLEVRTVVEVESVIVGLNRDRIVKDVLRNTTPHFDDGVMKLVSKLHFRVDFRKL